MEGSLPGTLLLPPERQAQTDIDCTVGGVALKCVASNVRRTDLPWESYELTTGLGGEGNLVVVEAISDDGFRTEVESQAGRDERIYAGDKLVTVLANRHSGTSESGYVPEEGLEITEETELHLLAAGCVVGINSGMPAGAREPMRFRSLGLVSDEQGPVDLIDICGGHDSAPDTSAPVILVCGTSAEVGKTTSSIRLIRALADEGLRVAGTKFSGTGRMRDILSLRDAGARPALDFPEVGLATTYTSPERYIPSMYTLFNYLNDDNPDIIVAEAGGDPIEANIPTFLRDERLMEPVVAAVLVSGDVMGMMGAIDYLRKHAPELPIYLTEPKGRNPTTTRERVANELPGFTLFNSLDRSAVSAVAKEIIGELRP
ncbi:MAG TPA: hypothetical protein VFX86_02620 [Candidatus Saccharimonadales bacterium]|nr:hypothetical protein [Candidatus Saccharimonadales bacterium]